MELIDKGINTPWQLTLFEAALFLEETGAESMKVGMKAKNGETRQILVSIAESVSQE